MHDKYTIPLLIFGTLVLIMLVFIITSFLIIHKQRQRRNILEKNEIAYKYQNHLLRTRLEVEEAALKGISREIHDHVNQILGVVRMNLFHVPKAVSTAEANRYVEESNAMVKDAIDHLRDLSHTLSGSGIKKMGLIQAIRKELNNVSLHTKLTCVLHCDEEELPLSGEQELLVFRVVQEALVNIVKHASATEVDVHIDYVRDELRIEVCDNGTGFNPVSLSDGIGLVNMHERATLLKATLNISSEAGVGSTVSLCLGLPDIGINGEENATPENSKNCYYRRSSDC